MKSRSQLGEVYREIVTFSVGWPARQLSRELSREEAERIAAWAYARGQSDLREEIRAEIERSGKFRL